MMVIGRLCFATNFDDMNERDALESNKLLQGVSLQGIYPILDPVIAELLRQSHD
jgi:hypothetical protein